ncbi:ASI1-immunoprecipitated protein 3 [Cardamine amara subsp. amara]|uniref:ASI1-immunoprecipitated protein 3 n=1 Tax=Cardamine amara subsp. amara TaxID=228776 RepID=A0ABD1AAU8_CARAN
MHGKVCEERKKKGHRRLMFRAPSRVIVSVDASGSSSLSVSTSTSFSKDGRKISVGDCALFKPPQDCPPFIGLIRLLIPEKEDNKLKLRVNWLYRPAELKLGKGILLEAQPNEIFYSFHEDEIPAASLLHPCKVTFLPKGVELPSGISSFVCWRVYDVMNQCIWWLTDQDYIDKRQQEVDKLLCKTRSQMHTTLQQGGRSPRSMNSPTTSQVKAGTDGMQNNNSFSSQGKGRKRERADQSSESVKRERSSRIGDSGSAFLRTESNLKSEIAKFTEKGGLVDSQGVERLVQLMLPERNEKKIELIGRSILAGVVAATDKFDCLSRFVQLRGLPVLDEWLQDIHRGKIGDASSPKENDRSVDDFLLILLRALDKLPVNLNALQTCNIGKSVNHLRSHKNSEIGKKARGLVDTWKKRVEAEMDAKSASNQGTSWPGRSRQSDATKASVSHLHPSKSVSVKIPSENSLKSATTSPSSTRSAPSPGTGVSIVNDGQQRNTNAVHREVGLSRSFSSQRSATSEKVSQLTVTPEKTLDVPMAEGYSNNKLIVKLPKRGRSPAQSVSGGSFEDPAAGNSRAPSPVPSEKHDQNMKEMNDTYRANFSPEANTESSQNNDLKNLSTVSDEVACSPSVNAGDEHGKGVNDSSKVAGIVNPTSLTVGDDVKTGKRHGGSHSSMNALIESCVRDSETNTCMAGADDVGMNLLATVAADEMSKTPVASPSVSRVSDSLLNDNSNVGNHTTQVTNSLDDLPREQAEPVAKDPTIVDNDQHGSSSGDQLAGLENVNDSKPRDLDENSDSEIEELQRLVDQCLENENSDEVVAPTAVPTTGIGVNVSDDSDNGVVSDLKTDCTSEKDQLAVSDTTRRTEIFVSSECKAIGIGQMANSFAAEPTHSDVVADNNKEEKPKVALSSGLVNKLGEGVAANVDRPVTEKMSDDNDCGLVNDSKADVALLKDGTSDTEERVGTSVPAECKAIDLRPKLDLMAVEYSHSSVKDDNKEEQKLQAVLSSVIPVSSGFSKGMALCVDRLVAEKINDMGVNHISQTDNKKKRRMTARLDSSATTGEVEHVETSLKSIEVDKRCTGELGTQVVSPKAVEDCRRANGSRVSSVNGDETEECTSVARDVPSVSASAGSEMEARVEFDLNEGFNGDETQNGNSNNFSGSLSMISAPSLPSRLPASITVAAAAKGAFVPRDDLLRNKASVGWRGSAATSAFRPAEPRKVQEVVPLGMNNVSSSDASTTAGKQTKTFLDFDLNVPDERVLEDLASQSSANPTNSAGGLDLDLNKLDDPTDMNNYTISSGHRVDSSLPQANLCSGGRRDFDLNDGPAVDDANVESSIVFSQHSRSGFTSQPMISGIRMNGENMAAGFSSWFPAANNNSAMGIPQVLPERGDQPFPVMTSNGPQRMVGPTSGVSSFTPDMYRGPVLLSSPAVSFPHTAFQYPAFPFGTSFPLSSANFSGASTPYMDSSSSSRLCFPPVNSQILGPGIAIPSTYPRPYVVNLPNGSSNGGVSESNSAKWFRSGLDLNSGPGGHETEGRDEATFVQRQLSSSGALPLKDDQARMYQMSGGSLRKKEPEGGWDGYKQSSWQ